MAVEIIYLACPYSHPEPGTEAWRVGEASKFAAKMIDAGAVIFSPLSHTLEIKQHTTRDGSWDSWEKQNRAFIEVSHELWVLMLPGWEDSVGVRAEIRYALELGKPVRYIPWS